MTYGVFYKNKWQKYTENTDTDQTTKGKKFSFILRLLYNTFTVKVRQCSVSDIVWKSTMTDKQTRKKKKKILKKEKGR